MRVFRATVLSLTLFGLAACGLNASAQTAASTAKRPMTFADLQAMKRVSDPQVSASGKWVLFSVTDVSLEKNKKTNHLWVVPMAGGPERELTFGSGEGQARFSPDGKWVAYVAAADATGAQIWLAPWNDADGTMGKAKRLTDVSTEVDGPIWSPNSKRLLFTSRVYPECSDQSVWAAEESCDKAKDDAEAKSPVKAQIFDHLLYRHWTEFIGEKRSHVLVVSATDGAQVRDLTPKRDIGEAEAPVFSLGGPLGYAWAPGSEEVAYVTNLDAVPAASTNNDVFTLLLDDAGAKPRKISTSLGSDDGPAYSPDGKYIAFRSQARAGFESDRFRLTLFDRLAGTTKEPLPNFDRWVDELVWSADSKTIYFASGVSGAEDILSVGIDGKDLSWRTHLGVIKDDFEEGEYGELHVSNDGRLLVSTRMTVAKPSEVFVMHLGVDSGIIAENFGFGIRGNKPPATGTLESAAYQMYKGAQLTHLNDAALSAFQIYGGEPHSPEPMESFTFKALDGVNVQGFIVRPPNFDPSKKYPLKFVMHGGPQTAEGDAWSYRWNLELLAANGYVVVTINRRGSTGYGQKFIDQVSGDWGGKAYTDLMTGLDFAEKKYSFIDKSRECALGASYGGFMANWVLTHTNRFQCIVTHDGLYDPVAAYGSTEELWFNEREFRPLTPNGMVEEGKPGEPWDYVNATPDADPFRRFSPMRFIKNAKTPTLVIHSQLDYRLDVSQGFELFTALQRLGVPSKMLYFPDEGHWVLKPQNSQLWYETVNDWCDRWTHSGKYVGLGAVVPVAAKYPAKVSTKRAVAK